MIAWTLNNEGESATLGPLTLEVKLPTLDQLAPVWSVKRGEETLAQGSCLDVNAAKLAAEQAARLVRTPTPEA